MAVNTQPESHPTVHEAWAAVMGEVQAVRKGDRNEQQRFMFRGIDAVMNAVGPAMRRHGVYCTPVRIEPQWRDAQTTGGKPARECLVVVTYRVTGPDGSYFEGSAPGESLDSGDKATPKAMSVAYRTFLLQALTIPTDDPDPDSHSYERETPQPAQQQTQVAGNPEAARRQMFALATQKLGGSEEPFKQWLAGLEKPYTGSRADLAPNQVAWIVTRLAQMPDFQPQPEQESTNAVS